MQTRLCWKNGFLLEAYWIPEEVINRPGHLHGIHGFLMASYPGMFELLFRGTISANNQAHRLIANFGWAVDRRHFFFNFFPDFQEKV